MSSVLVGLILFLQGTQAQQPGSIEGVVVRRGTSTPVARARVSILNAQTVTDDSGRFSFRNLQPGRYRLTASHNAYVPAQYGERSLGGTGGEIIVAPGQAQKDIVVGLTPRGAISGRLYDRNGDPVTNATVQAFKYAYQDGRRILVTVDSARSNDLGEYRLFWLAPGPYIIRAAPQESACADAPCAVIVETRNISGPAPVIGGAVRLDGRIAVRPQDGGETTLPVYFPGTTDASAASVIDLPPGVNFTGVDLMITPTRAMRIAGRLVNGVTGQPISVPAASVNLVPRRGTVATGSSQRAVASGTGTFEFRYLAPGSYDLVASAPHAGARLAASMPIEISSSDIEAVTLVLQPQLSIPGKISIENLQTDPATLNLSSLRVELRREPFTPELLVVLPTIGPDGTFTLTGVTPGDYRLSVNAGGLKGYLKTARYGALDALNPPFRIDGPGQLEIAISLHSGSLDAVVLDDNQKPFPGATVVLVPDPPRRQRFDLYDAAAAGREGRIRFEGLAPGDYRIFAWDDVPTDAWQDPDFLRLYEDRGRPVRINEGSNDSVDLKLLRRM
jgi:protocatechuate 3,4-dioxygenase beta subunit